MAHRHSSFLLTLCCTCISQFARADESKADLSAEYCIVGAGPAGLQLGHYLQKAGRSYKIFEMSHRAGSFFAKDGRGLPIQRKLLSLNKRVIGASNAEYRMRHDWNSLLDNPDVLPVTNRTKELYPNADVVAEYLEDFSKSQFDAGKIMFNTKVEKVGRCEKGDKKGFCMTTSAGNAKCEVVLWAGGFQSANQLWMDDNFKGKKDKYVDDYGDVGKKSAEDYEGKKILVVGNGNAAFETVEWLQDYAQIVHGSRNQRLAWEIKPGQEAEGTSMAMMTHYSGDVRATRLSLFDHYQLKMPDRILRFSFPLNWAECMPGKVCLWDTQEDQHKNADRLVELGDHFDDKVLATVKEYLNNYCKEKKINCKKHFATQREKQGELKDMVVSNATRLTVSLKKLQEDKHFLPGLLEATGGSLTDQMFHSQGVHIFDKIVSCIGWHVDLSAFDLKSLPVKTVHNGKYPKIKDTFEAVGVPDLYFGGTLGHSLDYKKSGGGFIHGFRYNMRALFRYLEETRHDEPYPAKSFDFSNEDDVNHLARHMIDRWNNAAGPYHMFSGSLVDGVIFEPVEGEEKKFKAVYMEELLPSHMLNKCTKAACLLWYFEYGKKFRGAQVLEGHNVGATERDSAQKSTFLHPTVEFFKPQKTRVVFEKRGKPALKHYALESSTFDFGKFHEHQQPLIHFLHDTLSVLKEDKNEVAADQ